MTKTLQSNQQSEVDAESVPSSLRIICDDANPATGSQNPISLAFATRDMSVQK